MNISAFSAWPDTSTAAAPAAPVASVGVDYRVAPIATSANDGISASAAFCGTVVTGYSRVASAPARGFLVHHFCSSPTKARSMDENQIVDGLSLKAWKAIFRPGMPEFSATSFVFTRESKDLVRIAFGNSGPRISLTQMREPVYTHAVTLTPEIAVDLAGMLLKFCARPEDDPCGSSADL
jgi:hypothetical protein